MQRSFTSGSRQAPDPFDQFLEEHNFYRKHTARDASCLFRVISEQMYDTQLHHLAIRKKCVRYMRKHRDFFQPLVDRDLDEYLDDMSKPKTYGTLVELQAVGYMFQRNVVLFEPFNLGNFYSSRSYFNDVFRVFYTPERHFDSVFTCDYIKEAAICQSICYEILYKDLYKLPDVNFAVEHMLHSPSLEASDNTNEYNEDGYCTRIHLADGRTFDFDLPQQTNCILENYKLCHFHYTNFPRLSDDLQREMKIYTNRDDYEKNALCKTAESLLPNKYVSCVRQLLQEGITPFPYKVAKALDPDMYRNIEFDAWNEQRKEQKLQNWYNGDSNFKLIRCQQTRVHKIFQVGAKCHVKLCKSENDLYTCHIQEIAVDKGYCIVFIEQLGEKRLVPYDSLTPLPPDQFKPWSLPYRFQRHMQKYSSVRFTRHYNYRFKLNGQFASHEYCTPLASNVKTQDYVGMDGADKEGKEHYAAAAAAAAAHHRNGCYYKLKQYTHFENFRAHTVEYCTMPLTVEHDKTTAVAGGNCTPINVENGSRAPSRSSANNAIAEPRIKVEAGTGSGVANGNIPTAEELGHFDGMEQTGMGGAFLLPDFHCFYPVHQYAGVPEEYYGYEGAMQPQAAALMPAANGGAIYYMCNPAGPPYAPVANNLYMQAPPPMHPPHALLTAAMPHGAQGTACYQSPCFSNAGFSAGSGSATGVGRAGSGANAATGGQGNTTAYNATPTARNRGQAANGPLGGRINWEARRSVESNGMDLPGDVATLRHFYNLGLECHHMHLKRNEDSKVAVNGGKENAHAGKLGADSQLQKVDENVNIHESKADSNNNCMPIVNLNTQTPNSNSSAHSAPNSTASTQSQMSQYSGGGNNNKPNHQNRRFPSRYFNNNKDRQSYQRNQQGGGVGSLAAVPTQNRIQNDYNTTSGPNRHMHNAKSGNAQATLNTTRQHGVPNMNAAGNGGSHGSASNLVASQTEQAMQTSSVVGFENGASNGAAQMSGQDASQTPPSAYNPSQNPNFAYGSYDYGSEPNAPNMLGHAIGAATAAAGGVYIPMHMPPTPYGIYAAPPAHQAVGMHHPPPPPPSTYLGPSPSPSAVAANMAMHGAPLPTIANGFYATPAGITAEMSENGEGLQLPCMSYPPPPMFYYTAGMNGVPPPLSVPSSASSQAVAAAAAGGSGSAGGGGGGIGTGGSVLPPHLAPQGFWCQSPNGLLPTLSTTPQNTTGGIGGLSTTTPSTSGANKRPRDRKQSPSLNSAD